MRLRTIHSALIAASMIAAPVATAIAPSPAQAGLFGGGFGGIVYDPRNHAENILSAARAMEQINNQIAQLQNEAAMLVNQARNLASLPHSALGQLQQSVQRTQALLGEAQRIAYDVSAIEDAFAQDYRDGIAGARDPELLAGARGRWQNSVAGFEDALKVQASVVGNIDGTRQAMAELVTRSQNATGALQAAQAGNQLVALQSQQLADLTALMAAQGRAEALEQARQAASQEQAREQLRRFLAPGAGYQPTRVTMFGSD
ncbi:P-type conjugative transfer protein TrbJ [Aestuariibius insulae]|uniref:P-type conjugative transfer protein TrbJ n=1 Tax=Aestuariibius insulae TaxID=2058287 RepID=UPI00345E34E5